MMMQAHPDSTEPHRILILDDTSTLLKARVETLRRRGLPSFEYQTAASAGEFKHLLEQRTWSLVLCHYTHSPFETTDLLRQVRHLHPQTPVIVVGAQVTTLEALELGRLGVRDFVEASDTEHLLACLQQAFASGRPADSIPAGDHSAEQIRLVLDSVYVPQGNPMREADSAHDMTTACKEAEAALRISEERYLATAAVMSEGLVIQGLDGTIVWCNHAAERILGLTAQQMIGRDSIAPHWRVIHEDGSPFPEDTHPAQVTLRTGEAQTNVVMGVYKPDGTLTWIRINSQPLINPVDQQCYAVVTTFADITGPKQGEAAIKAALLHEKELRDLKSRFVAMASHEFRNPLASILTATETLTAYWERMNTSQIHDRLLRIREQVDRMTEIMEDVFQLSRLHTGRTRFEPVPGDLDALCAQVVSDLAELPDYRDRIYYTCSQRPMNTIFDPRLLQQTISSLLHNALKFSAPETRVTITLSRTDGNITLRVADEGIGIPEDDMQHMFEPFHRAANVGNIQGTGLGLPIAKEALELHGGSITVESQENVGTTFIILLPDRR